jgi:hypothetical protein
MHQEKYINDLVDRFKQTDSAGRRLPYSGGDDKPSDHDSPAEDRTSYCSLVGALLYASVATRPDITETVSRLCKKMNSPNQADMRRAQRCLQYLKETASLGIQFTGESDTKIYCDSNWGGHEEKRVSRSGYAIMINGGPVVFRSILQRTQALSTAEAEYMALCAATQDALFVRQMMEEMGLKRSGPMEVLEDNQACIAIASNEETSQRAKHIDIRYHFVRGMISAGIIKLTYCPTYYQAADILTKPTDQLTFMRHRATLMGLPACP